MGKQTALTASDGHALGAYLAEPATHARGAVVVIQEIFGVTRHIQRVVDQYAAAGYLAIAPALFDRVARDADIPYTDFATGIAFKAKMDNAKVMLDVQAAIEHVKDAGKAGVVGYCWGGQVAYLSAAHLKIDAAIAYYGGGIEGHLTEKPKAPILFHYGEKDSHISPAIVAQVRAAVPEGVFYIYPADHGFNCDERPSFEPASAKLALERSIEFLHQHLG